MAFLLAILGAIGAIAYWIFRARQTGDALGEIADAALDVRNAARRFGFKRRTNVHPADSLEDPRIAALGVALAVAKIDGALTAAELEMAQRKAVETFEVSGEEASEMVALAKWLSEQCSTNDNAVYRLSRRIRDLAGADVAGDLIAISEAVATADGRQLDEFDMAAIAQMRRHLGV